MEFRRRLNCVYATLGSERSGEPVGVVLAEDIEIETWLGTADRVVLRHATSAQSVLLDIAAWQPSLLDHCHWLPAGTYMVGARIEEGVIGVMDGARPMLRQVRGEKDRLGRNQNQEAEQAAPWYMKTL